MTSETMPAATTDGPVVWNYTDHPPRGEKLWLLQVGGVAVTGQWTYNSGLVAWARYPKRNKKLERELAASGGGIEPANLRALVGKTSR